MTVQNKFSELGFIWSVWSYLRTKIDDNMLLIPSDIFLFKVNYKNTRKRCKICSKLTIMTLERCRWSRSGGFIVNFKHAMHLFIVFLWLVLNRWMFAGSYSNFQSVKGNTRRICTKICSKFTTFLKSLLFCNFIEIARRHGCSPVHLWMSDSKCVIIWKWKE